MEDKYILAGMLSAACLNYGENGALNCTAAANALQQHGVRVVVLCKFCKHFEGLRKEGWCNLHNCIRKLDSYCSYGERRK